MVAKEEELPMPSEVRELLLAEHEELRQLLGRVEAEARRLLAGEAHLSTELRRDGKALEVFLRAHLALEDKILTPTLASTPGFGKERVAALAADHKEQRAIFDQVFGALDRNVATVDIATELLELGRSLRDDMTREEAFFLSAELLRDETLPTDSFGG